MTVIQFPNKSTQRTNHKGIPYPHFFTLFSYVYIESESINSSDIDRVVTMSFEDVELTQNIKLDDRFVDGNVIHGRVLTKGTPFEVVWWNVLKGEFSFINWKQTSLGNNMPAEDLIVSQVNLMKQVTI